MTIYIRGKCEVAGKDLVIPFTMYVIVRIGGQSWPCVWLLRGKTPFPPGRDLHRSTLKGNGERGRMGCICIVIQPRRMKVVTAFENFTAEIIDHHTARLRLSFARRVSVATYVKGGKCPDHKSTADSNPFRPPDSIFTKRELRKLLSRCFSRR